MKIYVKFKIPSTLKEFIHTFFTIGKVGQGTTTYLSDTCISIQCENSKMRSFDDMFDLALTYYPETTYKELMHELLTFDHDIITNIGSGNEKIKLIPELSNCSTMSRLRIRYTICNVSIYKYPQPNIAKYSSRYNWYELLKMLDISNDQDYSTYINKYVKPVPISDVIDSVSTFNDIKRLSGSKTKDIRPIIRPTTKEHIKINAFARLQAVIKVYNKSLNELSTSPNRYLYGYLHNKQYGETGWIIGFDGVGFKNQKTAFNAFNKFPDIFKDLKD